MIQVNLRLSNASQTLNTWIGSLTSAKNTVSTVNNIPLIDSFINKTSFEGILQKLDLAIPLLGDIRKNVIMSPVSHVILKELQKKQNEDNANKISKSLEQFQEIAACMKTEWKKDTPYMPHCDPLRDQIGTNELACKKFISKILDLIRDCPTLKKVVLAYYIKDESPQGRDQTTEGN